MSKTYYAKSKFNVTFDDNHHFTKDKTYSFFYDLTERKVKVETDNKEVQEFYFQEFDSLFDVVSGEKE